MTSSDNQQRYKLVVYVPTEHAEAVRNAAFAAGAGQIGNYSNVSFTSSHGISNFTPSKSANPAIGTPGLAEQVDEVRIEITVVGKDVVKDAVERVRRAHPYEEVVVDIYRLEDF
ncbi:hypothetical protein QFC21_005464 [Naganishia friedmannii]|uniref:Uncharacterized protein n=1 Tax=Naganishia friedmannii TaxID=89922 RepID=A0ACC2V901_9TREE|nr:hypothetical protein QFC21_005464 [Naganishia friedmannii]